MVLIRDSFRRKSPDLRPYEQHDVAPVVKDVPFGDDVVQVTTFVNQPVKHPIPYAITADMFDVEHSPNAELINRPLIHQSQTDQIFSSYSSLLDRVNDIYAAEKAESIIVPPVEESFVEPVETE